MKKIAILLALIIAASLATSAQTYQQAFDSIKNMPDMKGVEKTSVNGNNYVDLLGITDAQMVVWNGEGPTQTATYGNAIYKIIGQLPVDEMVQCRMTDSTIFAIFAKPLAQGFNSIIILSDSARAGFTGAIIGYIADNDLNQLRQAILTQSPQGGTTIYLKALSF